MCVSQNSSPNRHHHQCHVKCFGPHTFGPAVAPIAPIAVEYCSRPRAMSPAPDATPAQPRKAACRERCAGKASTGQSNFVAVMQARLSTPPYSVMRCSG